MTEQVEEEALVDGVEQKLRQADDRTAASLCIDQEFGQRVFIPPAGPAQA